MKRTHLITLAIALFLTAAAAQADVKNSPGNVLDGEHPVTVCEIVYGEKGIESICVQTEDGAKWQITDGDHPDIDQFGEAIEKAHDSGEDIVIVVKSGDLKKVKRRPIPKTKLAIEEPTELW